MNKQNRFLQAFMIGTCLVVSVATAKAQPRQNPRDVLIENNRQEMDSLLLRKPILTSRDVSVRMAVLKQIGEDFRELQVLNNTMMDHATSSERVDYKKVAKLLGAIGGRASSLKSNLELPEVEAKKEKPAILGVSEAKQFLIELSKLDKTIMSFTHNPIFQKQNVVDVQLSQRASAELTSIIEQSSRLKKVATKLKK